ncbi:S-adenosyl-L-methionine-dependent methyltransferase [Apiospora arundinis]|uniref:S-adenosyl-L-methionine-dependent methyltransferase n=1 Tax=Apiospora arundinis TaxID=335852 RepID=A0ABR2HZH1_9PEZI
MPRLPPSLLHRARAISPDLATLLPACRDLESARNELRWIREHVSTAAAAAAVSQPRSSRAVASSFSEHHPASAAAARRERRGHDDESKVVASLCRRRARGEPLQYLLGSQPFGPLEIQCHRGVLIPRPETEAWTYALAREIAARFASRGQINSKERKKGRLRIVDFCTGTGCIPLLLSALLHRRFQLQIRGFDIEERAVRLAKENLRYNVTRGLLPLSLLSPKKDAAAATLGSGSGEGGDVVRFEKADIFTDDWIPSLLQQEGGSDGIDVLVSNPPYISTKGFHRDTGRSVRNFEPRLALVPHPRHDAQAASCAPEDVFYKRLCDVAEILRPKIILFEVGDLEQALRVAQMAVVATGEKLQDIEIWRDYPDIAEEEEQGGTGDSSSTITETYIEGRKVSIKGVGHGRSVLVHLK